MKALLSKLNVSALIASVAMIPPFILLITGARSNKLASTFAVFRSSFIKSAHSATAWRIF
ncbi:hypothetical protein D9M68_879750 [compost metagenome]